MQDFSDIAADPNDLDDAKSKSKATPYAVTGTILRVRILAESWDHPGSMETLSCGSFEIDGMDFEDSASGSIASITAVSVPLDSSIRREAHSQGWEDTTLREIAEEIAGRGNLQLLYELDEDPRLDRVDQRQEGDLAFLQRISREHGAQVKVVDGKLVLFDEANYEARPPIVTFKRGDARLLSIKLKQDSSNTAGSATATYKDPKSGKLVEETFTPPSPPAVGQKLIVNARPSDLRGDAHRNETVTAEIMAFSTLDATSAVNPADDFADIRDGRAWNGEAKGKVRAPRTEQGRMDLLNQRGRQSPHGRGRDVLDRGLRRVRRQIPCRIGQAFVDSHRIHQRHHGAPRIGGLLMADAANIIRVGQVSSVNPRNNTCRVAFDDLSDPTGRKYVSGEMQLVQHNTVSAKNLSLPDVGEHVLCTFLPDGQEARFYFGVLLHRKQHA